MVVAIMLPILFRPAFRSSGFTTFQLFFPSTQTKSMRSEPMRFDLGLISMTGDGDDTGTSTKDVAATNQYNIGSTRDKFLFRGTYVGSVASSVRYDTAL